MRRGTCEFLEVIGGQPSAGGGTGLHTLGNLGLLDLHKVAFLSSRNCPASLISQARHWAIRQCEKGVCVISGFHSPIEKEVLSYLLQGSQPIILALACGIGNNFSAELQAPLAAGRLLALTRYAPTVTHPCEEKCYQRNRLMLELADEVVIGYASAGGKLEKLCGEFRATKSLRSLAEIVQDEDPGR
jgi:predicted Rossmann fold nucleotide-binding protein DprA/Smf involved in DNA uptake